MGSDVVTVFPAEILVSDVLLAVPVELWGLPDEVPLVELLVEVAWPEELVEVLLVEEEVD